MLFSGAVGAQTPPLSGRSGPAAAPCAPHLPRTLRWGAGRPDLVRFNRVEGLSLGVRGQVLLQPCRNPLSLTAVVRSGTAMPHPSARLEAARENLRRRVAVSVYHELTEVQEEAGNLDVDNSLTALLGRDDGEYYRRTGMSAEVIPPTARPRRYTLRAYAERHSGVVSRAGWRLQDPLEFDRSPRENVQPQEGWELGLLGELRRRWGRDPLRFQSGAEVLLHGAIHGEPFLRARLRGGLRLPLVWGIRLEGEGAAGGILGDAPVQRVWWLGGPHSVRGSAPGVRRGKAFLRGRAALVRRILFGDVALFADRGWAGGGAAGVLGGTTATQSPEGAISSAGIGLRFLGGMIHVDWVLLTRGAPGRRAEAYLDALP